MAVTHDDVRIDRSCLVYFPPGTTLRDTNGNGVIHIVGHNHTIGFAPGCELRGAPADTPGDQLSGIGIRLEHNRGITLSGVRVHGFKVGILATAADYLVVDGGDLSDNYRQRLRSTPQAEDGADWLFPHHNDERKWRDEYGAALCVEASRGVTVRNLTVRRGQNGIVLDRVEGSRVYDNDCSFLSGWGLAMWRSSSNVVAHNAFDFCIRGHVEGVYNRGQDSAGILCFEQCNDNVFAENSVTHGGDGFFGFGGREAIGELWMDQERVRLRQQTGRQEVDALIRVPQELAARLSNTGCNRNLIFGNDFSYAAAHGIELTFSEDNTILGNRLVENAICGFWGGYSSRTLIAQNHIADNGGMAYGLERGGINMEHAADNRILENTFINNRCGIHLWWDDDGALHRLPGVAGNLKGVTGNIMARNRFEFDTGHRFGPLNPEALLYALQIRDTGSGHVLSNLWVSNTARLDLPQARLWDVAPGAAPQTQGVASAYLSTRPELPGARRPVGARAALRGRHQILLDEWGPWDHASPLLRPAQGQPGGVVFELLGLTQPLTAALLEGQVSIEIQPGTSSPRSDRIHISAPAGVHRYRVQMRSGAFTRELSGTLVHTRWQATFFAWPPSIDPRTNLVAWRALAESAAARRAELGAIDLPYGWGGPASLKVKPEQALSGLPADRFGMISRSRLLLPAGRWRFKTLSDDGIRVTLDGTPLVERWDWHGPTPDEAVWEQRVEAEVDLVVEHFEIDGYAVLRLDVEAAPPAD